MSFCVPNPPIFVPLSECRYITREREQLTITFNFKNGHQLRARYASRDAWRSAGEQLDELLHLLGSSLAADGESPNSPFGRALPLVVSLFPSAQG